MSAQASFSLTKVIDKCWHCKSDHQLHIYPDPEMHYDPRMFYQYECTGCTFVTHPCVDNDIAIDRWNSGMKIQLINSHGPNKGKLMKSADYYQLFYRELPVMRARGAE